MVGLRRPGAGCLAAVAPDGILRCNHPDRLMEEEDIEVVAPMRWPEAEIQGRLQKEGVRQYNWIKNSKERRS